MRKRIRGNRRRRLNYKKMFIVLIILLAIIFAISMGVTAGIKIASKPKEEKKSEENKKPEDIVINLVATGDIMCHTTNFNDAYNDETKEYDFSPVFANVKKYIEKADIAIGNLETTFAGKDRGYTGYPTFNSPSALGVALKDIGIDILSTANNHSLDKGYTGIVSTLDKLDEIGIEHMGTARSEEEQNTILIKNVKGIKIAFLSFTYGTNGIPVPAGKEYSVNLIDKSLILKQINLAKQENVDIICTSMHWGDEYKQKQNKTQEELADYLFKNGVDIIIGNHAHVVEPMEKREITLEDGTQKEVFVVYALGNFVSGQTIEHTKSTAILDMNIRKNSENGKISIDSVDYVPIYCYDKNNRNYKLIDIREAIAEYENNSEEKIEESLYKILKSELSNIEKVIGNPITKEENEEV